MSAEESDLRSTLESAFDEQETEVETGRPAADASQSVGTPAAKPADTDTGSEDRGDGRRTDGKFAKRIAEKPAVEAGKGGAVGGPAAAPVVETQAPAVDHFAKAPQSWKPGAREAWSQLPADVRAEVYRREHESARIMQETAQARQVTEYVSQMQQKFAPALQAEGVDALTASANLMQLSSRLRFGTPHEKAGIAAQIIRNYGVDVNALADALDGRPVQPGQSQQAQQMMTDPRVDQLLAQLNGLTQQRQEAVMQKMVGEVEAFGEGKDFFEDVREDMADLLEVAARRNIDLSLEQAYERACQLQPEISKVLAARAAAKAAGNQKGSTQRARIAASSVRGTPTQVSTTSQPDSLRATIEAAIDDSSGR
jgi:hypothetical protein